MCAFCRVIWDLLWYIKRLFVSPRVCDVFRSPKLFVPGGQTILIHRRGRGQTFFDQRGGEKYFMLEAVVAMMMLMVIRMWM